MNTHVIDHETVYLYCSLEWIYIDVIRLVAKILFCSEIPITLQHDFQSLYLAECFQETAKNCRTVRYKYVSFNDSVNEKVSTS